jgi:hypothetical protein
MELKTRSILSAMSVCCAVALVVGAGVSSPLVAKQLDIYYVGVITVYLSFYTAVMIVISYLRVSKSYWFIFLAAAAPRIQTAIQRGLKYLGVGQ